MPTRVPEGMGLGAVREHECFGVYAILLVSNLDWTPKRGRSIPYFAERTSIPRFYQVHLGERHFQTGPCTVLPFAQFCRETAMP